MNPAAGTDAGQPPILRLPEPHSLFAGRARRLRALAEARPTLSGYLSWLAQLADRQTALALALRNGEICPMPGMEQAMEQLEGETPAFQAERPLVAGDGEEQAETEPPLSLEDASLAYWVAPLLKSLVQGFSATSPAQELALRGIDSAGTDEIDHWLESLISGNPRPEELAVLPFVAAALQVGLSHRASQLHVASLPPSREPGSCPVCGGWPVASLLRKVGGTPGLRYLLCGFCATEWRHPRLQCVHCGSGAHMACYRLEDAVADLQAETCEACHTYLKRIDLDLSPEADPCADDLASLGLDVLMNEQGFQRLGGNLWLSLGR